jgi:deoxyadenosine/deoxycytidine kinase
MKKRKRSDEEPKEIHLDHTVSRIAVVGVCASGKSVLTDSLLDLGYSARCLAQEHSHVAGMWRAHGQPNIVIFLDASPETINTRTGREDWTAELVAQQHRRLADVRKYCDLYLPTDDLTEKQVLETVLAFLEDWFTENPDKY